jgi:hypothetical protein
MLQEYLDNVLENVVQGEHQVGRTKDDRRGETRFYFGTWSVTLTARLCEHDEIAYHGPKPPDVPGIRVVLENYLYGHGSGRVTYYFPAADPKCEQKILDAINSVRNGKSPWTSTPS